MLENIDIGTAAEWRKELAAISDLQGWEDELVTDLAALEAELVSTRAKLARVVEAAKALSPYLHSEPQGVMAHMSELTPRLTWYENMRPKRDALDAAVKEAGE